MKYLCALAVLAGVSVPTASYAQMFAYVNRDGEVMTVDRDTPEEALMAAPDIDEHSGVLMINSSADAEIVGDQVQVV